MASLVLEGGTFRGIFTAGVLDAFLENDMMFPYVIGVSAGIANGASYISRQHGRNWEIIEKYRHDQRYTGLNNFIKDRSLFGVDFIFEQIPMELIPFDYATYYRYPGVLKVVATDAQSGQAVYLDGLKTSIHNEVFKATCAVPGVFPAVKIADKEYFDGGVSDSIPIAKALDDGNQKHIIVLTQPDDFVKEFDRNTQIVEKIMRRKYPMVAFKLRNRYRLYNLQVKLCKKLEQEGKAIIINPKHRLNSTEKNLDVLKATYEEGRQWVYDHLDELKVFLEGELL
ncbi:MAG: patatin family protein [Erysipelotrichaceae bacterium]|nr:patatin family protein [Erysipelotrichaceae bacterium]MDY5252680.1 patatin family protein [Erysipelotrichaceae bacterium]